MDRRDVLKLGAVASLSGSSCAGLLANPGSVGAGEMNGFLASLDSALDNIASGSFFDRFLPANQGPELSARAKHGEELTKKTLRSLLLVGTLQELPPEQLAHEGVQQRLRNSMGEFDDAMFGMSSLLEGLSSTERSEISKALQENPTLGMKVMGAVDEEAAAFGVSMKQRSRLRAISSHTCSRLRQSPELTLTEYTGKMRKVAARHGARSELERTSAAAIGNALLWQGQSNDGTSSGGTLSPPPPPPPLPPQETPGTPTPIDQGQVQQPPVRTGVRPSHVVLTAGGIALGLGAALFGIGFATSSSSGGVGLALGITFGALLGIAGLITLIVGLILLAAGK
jgi:hypothetical protein